MRGTLALLLASSTAAWYVPGAVYIDMKPMASATRASPSVKMLFNMGGAKAADKSSSSKPSTKAKSTKDAVKKAVVKKAPPKAAIAKKAVVKKAVPKRPVAKKAVPKRPVAKKAVPKRPVAKKAAGGPGAKVGRQLGAKLPSDPYFEAQARAQKQKAAKVTAGSQRAKEAEKQRRAKVFTSGRVGQPAARSTFAFGLGTLLGGGSKYDREMDRRKKSDRFF